MESHVRVEPSSLRIELMLNKKCQRTLQIHNVSQKLVAYKVKTTKPERYFVGNNHGIIQPGGVGEVKILVEAMASLPENETKDKFLVMHMPLDSAPASLASHWKEMERKNKERKGYYYHSQKIKCRLTLPASHTAPKKMVEELKPDNFSTNTNPPAYDQAKGKGYDEAARDTANSRQDARMIESQLQQKTDDYEELMTYTVKLSNENQELKKKIAELQSQDGSQDKVIADLKSNIERLENDLDMAQKKREDKNKSRALPSGLAQKQATEDDDDVVSLHYWQLALGVVVLAIVVRYF